MSIALCQNRKANITLGANLIQMLEPYMRTAPYRSEGSIAIRKRISPADRLDTTPDAYDLLLQYSMYQSNKENPEDNQKRDLNESLPFFNGQNTPQIPSNQIGYGDRSSNIIENLIRKGEGNEGSYIGCQIEYL